MEDIQIKILPLRLSKNCVTIWRMSSIGHLKIAHPGGGIREQKTSRRNSNHFVPEWIKNKKYFFLSQLFISKKSLLLHVRKQFLWSVNFLKAYYCKECNKKFLISNLFNLVLRLDNPRFARAYETPSIWSFSLQLILKMELEIKNQKVFQIYKAFP